ncbi:hypothetical protein P7_053 [Pectobacterium phage vB_PcaM_P7_Pc]|nr:hypothetical protein P7_053 [Pectobacterium phage vB_PcaM_P7_Pc]
MHKSIDFSPNSPHNDLIDNKEEKIMMFFEELGSYRKYLRMMSKKDLMEHSERQMAALYSLQEENERLRQQCSRSNAQYLSACRSVGGVTLPPGV